MKHPFTMTALALVFIGASTWAEGASIDAWFDAIAGKKLVAVDESTFTLSPLEDGYSVEIVSPAGVTRSLSLAYVADGVGTVSDGTAKPIGVFRETSNGIKADFTDGHTESFNANPEGGISMTLSTPQSRAWCMRWYPEGHAFDIADRKAALAAYANKLGLSSAVVKSDDHPSCDDSVSFTQPPTPAPKPQFDKPTRTAAVPKHVTHVAHIVPVAPSGPVLVHVSQVHTIDPISDNNLANPVEQEAVKPAPPAEHEIAKAAPAQATAPVAQKEAAQTPPQDAPKPVQLASISKPGTVASSCLAVDSNGAGWGFRNTCAFPVQFAYCLKNGNGNAAACGSATGAGDVKANGFALVIDNGQIVTSEEEFRWVACAGTNDQVAAHLDRPDPPAGRCVPVKAM